MISIKSAREIELMRKTCALARNTLIMIEKHIRPGITTEELNKICHDYIVSQGALPSPLEYPNPRPGWSPFPKSICTSPNQVICHGIPDKKVVLKNSDILNIDVTTYLNKFHGDTNKTFFVGDVPPKTRKLVEITYKCMRKGIDQIRPGGHFGDIGAAIQEVAEQEGYGVVEDYCGHGIGRDFHEEPQIVHVGKWGTGAQMKPGMTFTVEPMINMGSKATKFLKKDDGWTVITADGSLSAQFEHTVLVTSEGHEILTLRPEES